MSVPTVTLQTPPGRGGIAVILLAGDGGGEILDGVFRPLPSHAAGGDGVLQLGCIVDGQDVIDEAIVCRRGRGSEINIHGGPAAARRTMELLVSRGAVACPAAPAAADSFSLAHPRWNNPGIGAEMLRAIGDCRSEFVVAVLTQQWSAGLSELAAGALEAIGGAEGVSLARRLRDAAAGLTIMQRLLRPAEVVLAGPPNVGKSALANALVGREVSIVHATAGTTRDWVRELAVPNGVPVWLTDTAGLWDLAAGVDAEAVRRARHRAEQADLVLLLSAGEPTPTPVWLHAKNIIGVWAKADLLDAPADFRGPAVSAHSGAGLDELGESILAGLGISSVDPARPMAFTPRQAELLEWAAECLDAGDAPFAAECLKELLTQDAP